MDPFSGLPFHPKDVEEGLPQGKHIFSDLTLAEAFLLSPDMPNEVIVQVALWTDVVGHLSNDIRANATLPSRFLVAGKDMIEARLRHLAVLCDGTGAVIRLIGAASQET